MLLWLARATVVNGNKTGKGCVPTMAMNANHNLTCSLTRALWLAAVLPVLLGCRQDVISQNEADIDEDPLIVQDETADRPEIHYPAEFQTGDPALNEFVNRALEACAEGDYDEFRLLWGTEFTPPKQETFKRLWYGVKEIKVEGVYPEDREPPRYFFHLSVLLRQFDPRGLAPSEVSGREETREFVAMAYLEDDQWRLGLPPASYRERILTLATQPALREELIVDPGEAPRDESAETKPATEAAAGDLPSKNETRAAAQ
jgi:hypothetical protein